MYDLDDWTRKMPSKNKHRMLCGRASNAEVAGSSPAGTATPCFASLAMLYYMSFMPTVASCTRTITVRLPEALADEIETESRKRGVSKSDVVRERLERARRDTELP